MSKIKDARLSTVTRVILSLASLPFFVLGRVVLQAGHEIAVVFGTLLIIAGITILALLWAFPTASRIGEKGSRIIFPAEKLRGPQPMYGVAESKIARGLHEEAMAEYQKIAAQYPAEPKPYLGMISVAIEHLQDPDWADAIYRRGMKAMENDKAKQTLTEGYRALLE
jgi:hypothetical protein